MKKEATPPLPAPLALSLGEGLGLAPERAGQPRMMTVIEGERDEETGHWYSPAAVREMLAAERERCAKIVEAEDVAPTDDAVGVQQCIAASIRRA